MNARWSALYVLLLAAPVWGAEAKKPPAVEAKAKAFVAALAKKDFTAAGKDFTDAVKKALPTDKLEVLWEKLVSLARKPALNWSSLLY